MSTQSTKSNAPANGAEAPPPDLSPEEVAALVRARKILKAHGLPAGYSVKDVSEWAGVSRKTAYTREARDREETEAQRAAYEAVRQERDALRQQVELDRETILRQDRDIGALELVKRAYEELKKSEDQEHRKAKRRR